MMGFRLPPPAQRKKPGPQVRASCFLHNASGASLLVEVANWLLSPSEGALNRFAVSLTPEARFELSYCACGQQDETEDCTADERQVAQENHREHQTLSEV